MFKWDYTKWSFFDTCPFKYHQKYVARMPEGPPSEALLKGRRAHDTVEHMLKSAAPDVYGIHPRALPAIQHVATQGDALIEKKITLSRTWQQVPNGTPGVWLTIKMDAVYKNEEANLLHLIDWKTGKTRAAEYMEQLDLYRHVGATLWDAGHYLASVVNLDDGKITDSDQMTRAQALQSRDKWIERATQLETETRFEPKPNKFCDWCPFGKSKGGGCRYG